MRSNAYRALPTALSITINVSSSLHPVDTFITLVEMSDVFATAVALRLRKMHITLFFSFLFFAFLLKGERKTVATTVTL